MAKIKKIKDYLKDGPPQFDVILRREPGKVVTYSFASNSPEINFAHEGVLNLPEDGKGIIQIVKRISDDVIFHQSDMIEISGEDSAFVIEFKEDRIHCVVAGVFDQDLRIVEINQLITAQTLEIGEVPEEEVE